MKNNNMENPNFSPETPKVSEAEEIEEKEGMIEVPVEGSEFFEESDEQMENTRYKLAEKYKEPEEKEKIEKRIEEIRQELRFGNAEEIINNHISISEIGKAVLEIGKLEDGLYKLIAKGGYEAKAAELLLQEVLKKFSRRLPSKIAINREMENRLTLLLVLENQEDKTEEDKEKIVDNSKTILELLETIDKMKENSDGKEPYLEQFRADIIRSQAERILLVESKEKI